MLWKRLLPEVRAYAATSLLLLAGYISFYARYTYCAGDFAWGDRYVSTAVEMANPSPPIGPALGQRGLNIMEFCKAFNAKTQDQEKGMPIPVTVTVFSDKSFTFEMKTAPASFFLKKAAKLSSGYKTPGVASAGSVTRAQVRAIAEAKMKDLNANDVENAMLMIEGSARSMCIEVKG